MITQKQLEVLDRSCELIRKQGDFGFAGHMEREYESVLRRCSVGLLGKDIGVKLFNDTGSGNYALIAMKLGLETNDNLHWMYSAHDAVAAELQRKLSEGEQRQYTDLEEAIADYRKKAINAVNTGIISDD